MKEPKCLIDVRTPEGVICSISVSAQELSPQPLIIVSGTPAGIQAAEALLAALAALGALEAIQWDAGRDENNLPTLMPRVTERHGRMCKLYAVHPLPSVHVDKGKLGEALHFPTRAEVFEPSNDLVNPFTLESGQGLLQLTEMLRAIGPDTE